MQNLSPGQKLKSIDSATWNAMVRAAQAEAAREASTGGRVDVTQRPTDVVKVKNTSGKDLARFDILGIDNKLFPGNEPDTALIGVKPSKVDHTGRFVILLEPIRDGQVGTAILSGITQAKVWVADQKHTHADVRFIDEDQPKVTPPCRLESGFSGAAQLLWKAGRTVTVTGISAAEQTYVQEGDDGDFVGTVNPNIKITHDDDNWSITSLTDGTLASTNGKGQHGYPPEEWSGAKVSQAPQACTVRLGVPTSMQPMTAKQRLSSLMQAYFETNEISPADQVDWMIDRLLLHFHDGSQTGIAFNDVQAISMRNEVTGENLTVPMTPTEGYNQHGHSSQFDGGWIPGMGPHDHRDNFNGGFCFAVFHPGTALAQQPWAM